MGIKISIMKYAVQKLENGQLFVESLQTTKKHGPKGKVLTVTSKENALKILSENEVVGVRGGMMSVSFRSLSQDLKPLAVEGDVSCLLVLNSPDGGYKIKEQRFEYPNQIVRKYNGLTTIAYTKQGKILDQLVFKNGTPSNRIEDEKLGFREAEDGQILISKLDKSIRNADISWEN